MSKSFLRSLRCAVSLMILAGVSLAQNSNSNLSSATANAQAGAYYYVARPNEMTMQINIWGFVSHPGRYEVATNIDLLQLLSYAGGPTSDADIEDVCVTRVVRRDGIITTKELHLNLRKLDRLEETKLMLQPGDTIVIEHTAWVTWREVVSVVTTAAIVTAAVAQIMNYSK
jgi:NADH:ubiquinone oxidoreductase subunit F (NADH-binding)